MALRSLKLPVTAFVAVLLALLSPFPPAPLAAVPAPSVLILYDSASDWGILGAENALMLENLLGHFEAVVQKKPVTTYAAGDLGRYNATFYVGAIYDEPEFYAASSPQRASFAAFVRDAANPAKPLVWINYNVWHLAWNWNPAWGEPTFAARFGLAFWGIDDWSAFNRVLYKDTELLKGVVPYVIPAGVQQRGPRPSRKVRHTGILVPQQAQLPAECIPEGDGKYDCVPALGVMGVVEPRKARAHAEAFSTFTNVRYPYITQSGNFWYVGDMPFAYASEEDRYLAFVDLLHDMLRINHAESHQALVRLEDVSGADRPHDVRQAIDMLAARRIPFGVATIPIYTDPLGEYTGGSSETIPLSRSQIASILSRAVRREGASIVQHGTTHQFGEMENPYNGASGDDAEFYRVVENPDLSLSYIGPVPGDSATWASSRTLEGKSELARAGLTAFAWQAPHYAASRVDYLAARAIYSKQWGRVMYFADPARPERYVWQFFPFIIYRDVYQYHIIPESLGYIEPDPLPGYPFIFPEDITRAAARQKVVRDGVVGFFYHPYLGAQLLVETVDGIRRLGYRFVSPADL